MAITAGLEGPHLGQDIDALLSKHAAKIAELRAAVGNDKLKEAQAIDTLLYDDIFLLRYVLTHKGDTKSATTALKSTLSYRIKNIALIFEAVNSGRAPLYEQLMKFQVTGPCDTSVGGWPVFCVRTGFCDIKGLMDTLSEEQVAMSMGISNEIFFRQCDQLTRKTRKLTKVINVVDLENYSVFMIDKRFFRAMGESSKFSARNYPQLLGKTVIINAPSYFRLLYRSVSVFMPKSFLEKQVLCSATSSKTSDISGCPFISKYGGASNFPKFLGGKSRCPDGLTLLDDRADALCQVTVPRKADHQIELEVPSSEAAEGPMEVKWAMMVQDYSVHISAKYKSGESSPLLSYRKVKAEDGLVTGVFEAARAGIIVVTFDNTYSMLRSKTVSYRFDLTI